MIDYQKYYQKIILTLESAAKKYEQYFVENDYLIFSPAFKEQPYYEVKAKAENFLHLTGLKVKVDPYTFYKDCLDKVINEDELNINYSSTKNNINRTARSKLFVINDIFDVFSSPETLVEENFSKNVISCTVAVQGKTYTLGFKLSGKYLRPMTLLNGKFLNENKKDYVELVLTKKRESKTYDKILVGDIKTLKKYESYNQDSIRKKLGEKLLSQL